MNKCGGCGKFLSAQAVIDGAKCGRCAANYHRACVNIPDKARVAPTWMCPGCKAALPRDNKPSTPVRGAATQYVDESEEQETVDKPCNLPDVGPEPCLEIVQQLVLVVEELRNEIQNLNSNECLLKEEIALLRADMQGSNERLVALNGLELEVKALRVEIREMREEGTIKKALLPFPEQLVCPRTKTSNGPKEPQVRRNVSTDNTPPQGRSEKGRSTSKDPTVLVRRANSFVTGKGSPLTVKLSASDLLAQANTAQQESHTVHEADDAGDWATVTNRRRQRVTVCGEGDVDAELQAVEMLKRIHLWSMKADTTVDKVVSYMEKRNPDGQQYYVVEKLELKHNNYSSFVITVPESFFRFFMQGKNWPPNARVNEWFRRRDDGRGFSNRPRDVQDSVFGAQ